MPDFEKAELAGGRAVLYRGDSLELLAAGMLKANAVVSDPPYGISYKHSGKNNAIQVVSADGKVRANFSPASKVGKIHGDDKDFDPTPWLCFGRVFLWGAENYRDKLPAGGKFVCWDKSVGCGPADSFVDGEFGWCSLPTIKRNVYRHLWKGLLSSGEDSSGPGRLRFHVSQKPRELMRWCIQMMNLSLDAVVLDPFAGSGSTGIAALSLGYRFVGVEIDAGHFATACARISDYWEKHGA